MREGMLCLFDVYPHPHRSALVAWVHEVDDAGRRRVSKHFIPYHPDFCVKSQTQRLEVAEAILRKDKRVESFWRAKSRLWLRGPEEEVLRVRPKRLQDVWAIATDLRRATHTKGFLFYDVDHSPESRWMHAEGLWNLCRLERVGDSPEGAPARSQPRSASSHTAFPFRLAAGEDRWTVDYPDPDLVTVRFEVQTQRAGLQESFDDALVSLRLGADVFACTTPGDAESEQACIRAFGKHLTALDPDVITTRHGDRFDIPFILRRIRALGLEHEVRLGRDADPEPARPDQQSKSIHTYGRWLFKTHAYYLRGRWHIDLAKKTLDSEDDRKDLYGIVYLSRVANRRAQDVNRNGAGFALQQMQIDLATDWGVALPWKRNLAEDWKDAATLCAVDRGGQIMVPAPGLYEDVAACDFSGYYPSLVVKHNLSSDAMNCACCPDGPVVPELNYHTCTKQYGHQAEILRRLWGHRRWAKAVLKRAKHEAAPEAPAHIPTSTMAPVVESA